MSVFFVTRHVFLLNFSIFMGIDLKSFWNSSEICVLILNKSNDVWLAWCYKRDRSNIVTVSRRFKFNCSMFFAILHWIPTITRYDYHLRKFYNRTTCFINYYIKMHKFFFINNINIIIGIALFRLLLKIHAYIQDSVNIITLIFFFS